MLALVPPDGWISILRRGRTAGRSVGAIADALTGIGIPAEQSHTLAPRVLDDRGAVELPTPRSLRMALLLAALVVRLLAALPRRLAEHPW